MSSNFDDVGAFHTKFGLPSVTQDGPRRPSGISRELIAFRVLFLLEEVLEFVDALGGKIDFDPESGSWHFYTPENFDGGENIDHAQAFDAMIDVVYVALGNAHMMGYPWQPGWDAVQRANMAKVRASADGSDSVRGTSFDVVKPEGWTPPDMEEVLRLAWARPKPDKPQYGHDREGNQCAPELCGGSRYDPCPYSPASIAALEEAEEKRLSEAQPPDPVRTMDRLNRYYGEDDF